MLKKVKKLSSLGYILKDISIIINIGDLINKRYTPGKPTKSIYLSYLPPNTDIKTAEFVTNKLYVKIIPAKYKIESIVKENRGKHKNKIHLFISLFVKGLETIFGKRFVKIKSKYNFQYKCGENHKICIDLIDKRTFKKGIIFSYSYHKPIIKFF